MNVAQFTTNTCYKSMLFLSIVPCYNYIVSYIHSFVNLCGETAAPLVYTSRYYRFQLKIIVHSESSIPRFKIFVPNVLSRILWKFFHFSQSFCDSIEEFNCIDLHVHIVLSWDELQFTNSFFTFAINKAKTNFFVPAWQAMIRAKLLSSLRVDEMILGLDSRNTLSEESLWLSANL